MAHMKCLAGAYGSKFMACVRDQRMHENVSHNRVKKIAVQGKFVRGTLPGRVSQVKDKSTRQNVRVQAIGSISNVTNWIGTNAINSSPFYYFLYLMGAGFGVPLSEDALVVWVGSMLARNAYSSIFKGITIVITLYWGVVLSDMVTFYIGSFMNTGVLQRFFPKFRESNSIKKAIDMVNKHGGKIGFIQRFILGFRGPLCLACGITGVSPRTFFLGTSLAALCTLPLQLLAGVLLRNSGNPYLAALAVIALPTLFGNVLGTLGAALGIFFANKKAQSTETKI